MLPNVGFSAFEGQRSSFSASGQVFNHPFLNTTSVRKNKSNNQSFAGSLSVSVQLDSLLASLRPYFPGIDLLRFGPFTGGGLQSVQCMPKFSCKINPVLTFCATQQFRLPRAQQALIRRGDVI